MKAAFKAKIRQGKKDLKEEKKDGDNEEHSQRGMIELQNVSSSRQSRKSVPEFKEKPKKKTRIETPKSDSDENEHSSDESKDSNEIENETAVRAPA